MRDLGYIASGAIEAEILDPCHLVSITLLTPMFLSTRDGVSAMGEYWTPSNLQLGTVSSESADLKVHNTNYQYTLAAMQGALLRQPVKIFTAFSWPGGDMPPYVTPGYVAEGYIVSTGVMLPILRFDGYISQIGEFDESGEWLPIQCIKSLPKKYGRRIRAPFANHLPVNGQLVEWEGETYRIES